MQKRLDAFAGLCTATYSRATEMLSAVYKGELLLRVNTEGAEDFWIGEVVEGNDYDFNLYNEADDMWVLVA